MKSGIFGKLSKLFEQVWAPALARQWCLQQDNPLPVEPQLSPPTDNMVVIKMLLLLAAKKISCKLNFETPQPDKHCPPPGSLFRFPPEFWNRAKRTLWYWPGDICILGICRLFWNTATDSEILDGYQILTRGYLYLGYLHVGHPIKGMSRRWIALLWVTDKQPIERPWKLERVQELGTVWSDNIFFVRN